MHQCSRQYSLGLTALVMAGIMTGGAIAGLVTPASATATGGQPKAAALYPGTFKCLMAAVEGEMQAGTNYLAFADAADKEGHKEIAAIFRAIAAAEFQHARDEFSIAQGLSSVEKPKANKVTPGTTKENLQSAVNGEAEEYTKMYPEFIKVAHAERMLDARGIFTLAKLSEEVHAGIFADLLKNFENFDGKLYAKIYRCGDCGNIVRTVRPMACSICGDPGKELIEYVIVR